MSAAFDNLPQEKKDKIITISMEEFAEKGYKNASTNTITTRADISKGLLFHYFKSKKNLYLYIIHFVSERLAENMLISMKAIREDDFFTKIKKLVMAKLSTALEYPTEYQLFTRAMTEPPKELQVEIMNIMQNLIEKYTPLNEQVIFESLDPTELRDTIPYEKAIEISRLLFEQLGKKYQHLYKGREQELLENPKQMLEELDLYVDVLKHGIYK